MRKLKRNLNVEATLEEGVDDMPIEYHNTNEKNLTKRQRLMVWNLVNDPLLTFRDAARKAGYKNNITIGKLMAKKEGSQYSHVRREYERLMLLAKKKFELTHERAVEDLYKLRDDAWGKGAFNAAIQAQGLLLKVGGLIIDRREVLHGKIHQMSREEGERRLQDLLGQKVVGSIDHQSGDKIIESK
jgi:hypothetical protein